MARNENLNEVMTRVVIDTNNAKRGSKSHGVKIATRKREVTVKVIQPFSK